MSEVVEQKGQTQEQPQQPQPQQPQQQQQQQQPQQQTQQQQQYPDISSVSRRFLSNITPAISILKEKKDQISSLLYEQQSQYEQNLQQQQQQHEEEGKNEEERQNQNEEEEENNNNNSNLSDEQKKQISNIISSFHSQSDKINEIEKQIKEERNAIESHRIQFEGNLNSHKNKLTNQNMEILQLENEINQQQNVINYQQKEIDSILQRHKDLETRMKRIRLIQFLSMPKTMQFPLNNGETFVWLADSFQKHKENCDEIYSPPFTSQKYNYCFRIKIRWNENGSINAGSLSAGLNLVKGENDDKCEWPFNLTFTLNLLDIFGYVKESASMCAKDESEDTISVAFQRPEQNNELSRGWGNYVTWSDHNLVDLVTNDTLHFELHMKRE